MPMPKRSWTLAHTRALHDRRKKKRVQLGIIVSRETKKTIEEMARNTGVSQGLICEGLIAKGLDFDRTLMEIINKLSAIEWALNGIRLKPEPDSLQTMFKPMKEGIGNAVQPAPLSNEDAARKLRDYEERIARLEAMMRSKQDEG